MKGEFDGEMISRLFWSVKLKEKPVICEGRIETKLQVVLKITNNLKIWKEFIIDLKEKLLNTVILVVFALYYIFVNDELF